jgi:hypothetical protein
MMLVLLLWFLIAPVMPGADSDAVLVGGRLRGRVTQMLSKVVFAGVCFWLACSTLGVATLVLASAANAPDAAVLGLLIALGGVTGAGLWIIAVCLLEKAWLNALGLPADWRGPWLAGELAEHIGWKRRAILVSIPPGSVARAAPKQPRSRAAPAQKAPSRPALTLHRPAAIPSPPRFSAVGFAPSEDDTAPLCWLAEPTEEPDISGRPLS